MAVRRVFMLHIILHASAYRMSLGTDDNVEEDQYVRNYYPQYTIHQR